MIWNELGRLCGLTIKNRRQNVKDIAEELGIDITKYMYEKENLCKLRSSNAKLPGNEISVPSMPTINLLKDDIKELLSGFSLSPSFIKIEEGALKAVGQALVLIGLEQLDYSEN